MRIASFRFNGEIRWDRIKFDDDQRRKKISILAKLNLLESRRFVSLEMWPSFCKNLLYHYSSIFKVKLWAKENSFFLLVKMETRDRIKVFYLFIIQRNIKCLSKIDWSQFLKILVKYNTIDIWILKDNKFHLIFWNFY